MATTSSMFMYSLTVQPPTAPVQAVVGQFAGTKQQQIITACGSRLTLLQADAYQAKLNTLLSHDCFGIIRSLSAFRLAGSIKDYLIVGSDSGRITILNYNKDKNKFERAQLETFGKSGVRRVLPGQYLTSDPKGRACMIASVEKNKLVYVLNRSAQAELTISSPLEAHKPHTLVFALTALDVGYENPIFAALEVDYGESDQDPSGQAYEDVVKELVYYELDLGLNHVVRKWSEAVDRTANMLFHVPGGSDGPSGVLVCGEDNITYRHHNQDAFRVPIPRRRGATEDPNRKRYIVSGLVHRMKSDFFFLLQSEDGDLFKLNIEMLEDNNGQPTGEVKRLKIKYFDTVPVATSLCILKTGFLFVACETGNHILYQFEKLGDDDDEIVFESDAYPADPLESYDPAYFHLRPLDNMIVSEKVSCLNPIMGCSVTHSADHDAPQIHTISGTRARSTFRTIKQGLEVTNIVDPNPLPAVPTAIWTTKLSRDDPYDGYIVLSFPSFTLMLGIGETVEEVSDTGFLTNRPTLAVQLMTPAAAPDSLVQVHPYGLRQIRSGGEIQEWSVPQHRTIVAATTNTAQIAIALSSGELVYFQLADDGSLAEYDERPEMSGTVTALSLGQIPEGRQISTFLAVGCDDSTVRILSLAPDSTLQGISIQGLSNVPTALCIMPMIDSSTGGSSLFVHIGLSSGVYLRTMLDEVTGDLSDTRSRFLGPKPVRLFQVSAHGQPAVIALSSRSWLGYSDEQTRAFTLTPLDYVGLEWASNFRSEQYPEAVVGIEGQYLRVFTVARLSNNFLQDSIPLKYTPRQFAQHPEYPLFYVVQSDNGILSPSTQARLLADPGVVNGDANVVPPDDFGYPRAIGHWASCLQVIDPSEPADSERSDRGIVETIEFEENEAAVSVALVSFSSQDDRTFLVVGTGKDMVASPRSSSGGHICIYSISEDGRTLTFEHKTKTEEPPLALLPFHGRLLAGIGNQLYIFELGMKQCLRKARSEVAPNLIVGFQTQGSRIIVSDVQESVIYVVFSFQENRFVPFVDDTIPRWTTATAMVDYETVAGGDKFGNLWLVRSPQDASTEADEEGSGARLRHERQYLQGAPSRLSLMVHFFTQDIPMAIQKTALVAGGRDVLLWAGIQGTLGVLIPFAAREDVTFFQNLENQMRAEDPPLCGRDHLMYRGYYAPVKGVIDGDLCERYLLLSNDKKAMIAAEIDSDVRSVEKKIQEARTREAF